jgi:acyl-coenzyme A thioesterase PaaI-like protein
MIERSGPFWDAMRGRTPLPRAAATLGMEFIDADVEAGTIELGFVATEDFTNPAGNVLGAFQAAMLHDTVGPALLATLAADRFQSTLQLSASFLRPVRPGRLVVGAGSSTATATWCTWRPRWPTPKGWSWPPPPPSHG